MKIKLLFIAMICITLAAASLFYIVIHKDNNSSNEILSYTYEIEVTVNRHGNYTLYLPTPVWFKNQTNADFIWDNIQINSGSGQFSSTTSEHGFALVLTASGNVSVVAKGQQQFQWGQKPRFILSMQNDTDEHTFLDGEHYVRCSKHNTNQSISVSILFDTLYTSGNSDMIFESYPYPNGVLDDGWQIIRGKAYMIVE